MDKPQNYEAESFVILSHLAQELVGEPGVFEKLGGVHGADLALGLGVEALVVHLILREVRPGYLK